MSGSSYQYQRVASSYPQSSYSLSANTGGRPRDTTSVQTPSSSYASSSDRMERFWVTGQGTGRSGQHMSGRMSQWDQQWSYASSRR